MAAADPGDLVEAGDGGVGVDGVVHEVGKGLAGELVDDVEDLDHPAGGGDVELVVERPHVVGPGRLQPTRGRRRLAEALALAALGWHAQALLAPQALDLLAVHPVALPHQHDMRAPVTPARMALRDAPQPGPQLAVRVGFGRAAALGGTALANDRTGPPLRQVEPGHQHVHGSASPGRAYQFPFGSPAAPGSPAPCRPRSA
jgi:hypothetical protein